MRIRQSSSRHRLHHTFFLLVVVVFIAFAPRRTTAAHLLPAVSAATRRRLLQGSGFLTAAAARTRPSNRRLLWMPSTRRWSSNSASTTSTPNDDIVPGRVPNPIVPGTIYFVATPLGNLGDMTLRALDVLRGVDMIASEDTRTTGLLLKALGLEKKKQVSHHQHNEQSRVPELVQKVKQENLSIAVVSDAGTPGISDPGNELAAACWAAGVPLVPVPGACAAVAAVSVAGFASTEFVFFGFLPAKSGKNRKAKLAEVAEMDKPCVIYESPNRVVRTLMELIELDETGGERLVLCARELTKLHEELFRGTLTKAVVHFGGGEKEETNNNNNNNAAGPRGEFTLVVGPRPKIARGAEEMDALVRDMLRTCLEEENLSASEAAKKVSKALGKEAGLAKSDVYKIALELK